LTIWWEIWSTSCYFVGYALFICFLWFPTSSASSFVIFKYLSCLILVFKYFILVYAPKIWVIFVGNSLIAFDLENLIVWSLSYSCTLFSIWYLIEKKFPSFDGWDYSVDAVCSMAFSFCMEAILNQHIHITISTSFMWELCIWTYYANATSFDLEICHYTPCIFYYPCMLMRTTISWL
jgi:hypothetical protein